ncbi:MAG: hypothetical protein D6677_06080 [Calditrichaeota bacterium]|nr:MAG: hypothetical protein D6677_06080 [Calditrichota bacterium]
MKRLTFKVTLLSDIIIHADSATEGHKRTLDFIPGSNFLGVLARKYNEFDNPYDIFHGDKVRFGDAHISHNGRRSFKAPLSWYKPKGGKVDEARWVHHYLNKKQYHALVGQGIQLQQVREGWIVPREGSTGWLMNGETNYVIKSAYDRKRRGSAEGRLFGFKSLKAGSEWICHVDIAEEIDERLILDNLCGKRHIGKSRSAQYGSVAIESVNDSGSLSSTNQLYRDKYLVIYADSRLAFFDEYGQPTLRPAAAHFNLPEGWQPVWEMWQTRYQVFAPYNFKNRRFLADRVVFNKGSVFVFEKEGNAAFDPEWLADGVGEFKNEGFGQVVANPEFLLADETGRNRYEVTALSAQQTTLPRAVVEQDVSDSSILNWASHKDAEVNKESEIYRRVNAFIKDKASQFSGISSSQWGQMRSIAARSMNMDELKVWLFKKAEPTSEDGVLRSRDKAQAGFLEHGKMLSKWKRGLETFKNEIAENEAFGTDYVVILAAQMQRVAKKREEKNGK